MDDTSNLYISNTPWVLISWVFKYISPWNESQRILLMIKSTLVQVMAWCHQATIHYLNRFWQDIRYHLPSLGHNELKGLNGLNTRSINSPTDPFNSLWPSDTIWQHRYESTLVQILACCQTAPNHYLNQCWLIISEVLWHSDSPDGSFSGYLFLTAWYQIW